MSNQKIEWELRSRILELQKEIEELKKEKDTIKKMLMETLQDILKSLE